MTGLGFFDRSIAVVIIRYTFRRFERTVLTAAATGVRKVTQSIKASDTYEAPDNTAYIRLL